MEKIRGMEKKPKNSKKKYKESDESLYILNNLREDGDGKSVQDILEEKDMCETSDSTLTWESNVEKPGLFLINIQLDGISLSLFVLGLLSRFYKLQEPNYIVFDELHFGKYVSMYINSTFLFSSHPPLGIQLISLIAYICGFDGNFKFEAIGTFYGTDVFILGLRLLPAICGSLMIPMAYHILLEFGLSQWTAILGSLLILLDNALLTQSRFILMESILICFSAVGFFCALRFFKYKKKPYSLPWWFWMLSACIFLTFSFCVKFVGFYSYLLFVTLILKKFWDMLSIKSISDRSIFIQFCTEMVCVTIVPILIYLAVFYIHLTVLYKAGPHDNIMTSAFQASLEGGLASITKGQPLIVAHGSQITLRHTHGRTCWLHSHNHVYPVRYPDDRGSSHQQQVTCYTFKDVNNWWIVKRPDKNELVVEKPVDGIKHGEIVQLVHGLTSRALNSHDVSAPMSPHCQEVSCYIDYNVSMPAENLWRVDIINREQVGNVWQSILSEVRLIHVTSGQALKFSSKQLPEWGFNQFEVVTVHIINQDDTIWNVEEHLYTKSEEQKDRERDILGAEMIPLEPMKLSFWSKFFELQYKMLFKSSDSVQSHMFSSYPSEWPMMTRGIAYWVSATNNAQIHLLGNIVIWYSGTFSVVIYCELLAFYLLRRRRLCFDLDDNEWEKFKSIGYVFLTAYFYHFIPYFFVDRTLFLYSYLHAYFFKILLTVALFEHIYTVLKQRIKSKIATRLFVFAIIVWILYVAYVFKKFSVLCFGTADLTLSDIRSLKWKNSWDFIFQKHV